MENLIQYIQKQHGSLVTINLNRPAHPPRIGICISWQLHSIPEIPVCELAPLHVWKERALLPIAL